jgi:GxxExxY protein
LEGDPLTQKIIGCAIEVHRTLGPGLLESTYERCLTHELHLAGLSFQSQLAIPVDYKGIHLDCGYRLDLLIEGRVIIELKSVERLNSVHDAQILTYMKLSHITTGLLINFNQSRLIDGIKRLKL